MRLVLKFSRLFRAVCSLFSNSLLSFERFLLPVLKFPSPLRAIDPLFTNSLVSFERIVPCSQNLYCLSNGVFPVLKLPSPVSFERFAPCSQILYNLLGAVCALFSISWSLSNSLLLVPKLSSLFRAVCFKFSNSLVPFEPFARCSYTLYSLSIGLLPVPKFPSPIRSVCALFSNYLVSVERFAPCSQIP